MHLSSFIGLVLLIAAVYMVAYLLVKNYLDEHKHKARSEGYDVGYNSCAASYSLELTALKELLSGAEEKNRNEWARGYGDAQSELLAVMKKHPKTYVKFIKDLSKKVK